MGVPLAPPRALDRKDLTSLPSGAHLRAWPCESLRSRSSVLKHLSTHINSRLRHCRPTGRLGFKVARAKCCRRCCVARVVGAFPSSRGGLSRGENSSNARQNASCPEAEPEADIARSKPFPPSTTRSDTRTFQIRHECEPRRPSGVEERLRDKEN